MSEHVLTFEVEGIQAERRGVAKLQLGTEFYGASSHSVLFVSDDVAQRVRLGDTIEVTLDVPADVDPEPDEPEDAPVPLTTWSKPNIFRETA